MRIDFHLHTHGSWDCLSDPEGVVAAALSRGLDRIAITDHNTLGIAREMAARHPERVIAGEEVRTAEGVDVIGLYLSEEIPKGTPAEDTCRRIHEQGGIAYLPHPYASGKGGSGAHADRLAPLVDVVEVFNSRLLSRDRNGKGEELARRHGRLRAAGSDAHTLGEIGNAWVELPAHPNEPEALIAALAEAKPHGKRAWPQVFVYSNLSKLRKRLGAGRWPGGGRRNAGSARNTRPLGPE